METGVSIKSPQCLPNSITENKKSFYKSLDEKQISDNKAFWKNVKPFFSNKV